MHHSFYIIHCHLSVKNTCLKYIPFTHTHPKKSKEKNKVVKMSFAVLRQNETIVKQKTRFKIQLNAFSLINQRKYFYFYLKCF